MAMRTERQTDITKQRVAFAALQTRQRSSDVTLLYTVTDIRNIKRYLLGQSNVTGKRKLSAESATEMCNILQNSLSQTSLSEQRKITPLSAPDHWVNLPEKIKKSFTQNN
jgi:hypothetical protein